MGSLTIRIHITILFAKNVKYDRRRVDPSALRGPGFGSKPGLQPVGRAGPLHNFVGWAYILRAWARPGLKTI